MPKRFLSIWRVRVMGPQSVLQQTSLQELFQTLMEEELSTIYFNWGTIMLISRVGRSKNHLTQRIGKPQ